MDIKNGRALVTGGNSGIGLEIAKKLKEKGSQVVIVGQDESRLRKASEEIGCHYIQCDVSQEEAVNQMVADSIDMLSGLNVLINNAGYGKFASLVDCSLADFQRQWEVNTKGQFLVAKACAKYMIAQKYGNIINVGSTAALKGFAGGTAYVSSKFGVSGMTECWQAELRPHNIRVMQINPSEVITSFRENAGLDDAKDVDNKLKPSEIAHLALAMLEMNDVGFIPNAAVWATNPWGK